MIGIENEYGITAGDEQGQLDPTGSSTAVVNAELGPGQPAIGASAALRRYRSHVPLPDDLTRIFLDESSYATRMLINGGRLYVDHGHPEYCSPEVRSAHDAVLWDQAGDLLVRRAAAHASQRLDARVRLYKNNTDGKGSSYGCHENYLLPRSLPFAEVVAGFTGYLVSRIILTGAGRVGLGQSSQHPGFQLSQRADFFEALVGLETTVRRPIINTRDEPHADSRRWRRLHVITGDALVGEYSTWLKVGSAALVLQAITAGARFVQLADPLAAFATFSRDLTLTATVPDRDGRPWTAVQLQRQYAAAVAELPPGAGIADGPAVQQAWLELLDDAESDPALLADRVDWAAKLRLLTGMRERAGLAWDDPRLAALDLQWAELDPERGLGLRLLASGGLRSVVDPAAVERATSEPPQDTRAGLRGQLLGQFGDDVLFSSWDQLTVVLRSGRAITLLLDDPLLTRPADSAPDWLSGLSGADELVAAWQRLGGRVNAS